MSANIESPVEEGQSVAPSLLGQSIDPEMADFVLGMTKAMCRTGYYSVDHPEGRKALLGLYDDFVNLMEMRGHEFSFQLSFSRGETAEEDVALYDGDNDIQLMRDVLAEGTGRTFTPKLVEFFHRQGLLSFTLAQDLTQEHFEKFIERMTQAPDMNITHPGEAMSRDLASSGVRGVSIVFNEDRIKGLKGSIPWRAELALTRLRKDLRMIPMLANASVDEMRTIKSRLMDDILRGIQQAPLLLALARHLGEALQGQEEVMTRAEAEEHLILGLGESLVPEVAVEMSEPWLREDSEQEEHADDRRCRARLIKLMLRTLISRSDKPAAHALAVLYTNGYIDLDNLSASARTFIRANALAEAALESPDRLFEEMDHSGEDEPFAATIRDLRLAAETLLDMSKWETANDLIATIYKYAKGEFPVPVGGAKVAYESLQNLATEESIEALQKEILNPMGPNEDCLNIARMFEPEAALMLLIAVLEHADLPQLQQWCIDELVRRAWDIPDDTLRLLEDHERSWRVLRGVMIALRKTEHEAAYNQVAQLFEHIHPQVRSEALKTMASLAPERSSRIISRALEDSDPELRRNAALAVASAPKTADASIRTLLKILRNEREPGGMRLQALASLGAVIDKPGISKEVKEESLEGIRLLIEDKYGSKMQRFKRFAASRHPPPDFLLAAACRVIGNSGHKADIDLLEACNSDESQDVRDAARLGLASLREKYKTN
ncbi:MAG: HEAT repeat domain-containing protein [Myxococcota bacterium]|nr:HEAT repeat domain-containing protein [Myxococcota bacterium]